MAKPGWKSIFEGTRVKAVEAIEDQQLLMEISVNDRSMLVFNAALKKLHDSECLMSIVLQEELTDERRVKAAEKVTSQDKLGCIVKSCSNPAVRKAAVRRLQDETILMKTIEHSTDEEELVSCASSASGDVKLAAVLKTNALWNAQGIMNYMDMGYLAKVALQHKQEFIRRTALEMINEKARFQNNLPKPIQRLLEKHEKIQASDLCPNVNPPKNFLHDYDITLVNDINYGLKDDDDMKASKWSRTYLYKCRACGWERTVEERN